MVQTTLNGAIGATDTSLVVTSAASFPATPFLALIASETTNTAEVVQVTARAGTTCTVVRNYASEPWCPNASAHASGAVFSVGAVPAPNFARGTVLVSPADASQLPAADPHVVGQLWSSAGAITRSAG